MYIYLNKRQRYSNHLEFEKIHLNFNSLKIIHLAPRLVYNIVCYCVMEL